MIRSAENSPRLAHCSDPQETYCSYLITLSCQVSRMGEACLDRLPGTRNARLIYLRLADLFVGCIAALALQKTFDLNMLVTMIPAPLLAGMMLWSIAPLVASWMRRPEIAVAAGILSMAGTVISLGCLAVSSLTIQISSPLFMDLSIFFALNTASNLLGSMIIPNPRTFEPIDRILGSTQVQIDIRIEPTDTNQS